MKPSRKSFGTLELIRLWLSYQRYAFAFFLAAIAPLVLIGIVAPRAWYLWIPTGLLAAKFVQLGLVIYRRFPRKMRVTAVAFTRIQRGSFQTKSVLTYCGDPCYRVVANEILANAGIPSAERKTIIAEFKKNQPKDFVLLVDRTNGVSVQVGGNLAPINGVMNFQLGGLVNDVSATGRVSATTGLSATGRPTASGHPSASTTVAPESTGSTG